MHRVQVPLVVLVLSALLATTIRWTFVDDAHARRQATDLSADVLQSPGPALLQAITFEHALAFADLTWLAVVQELGRARTLTSASWDRVERWADIALDLDRRYFTIYHSVAVNLSVFAGRVQASDAILLRGMQECPDRWELPMLAGYNAYFVHGDARLGADYIHRAAVLPGAPNFLASLSGRMRFQGGDELGAIVLLESMLPNLEGAALEDAQSRIALLKSEIRFQIYDAACASYRDANGGVIPRARELHDLGKVKAPPVDYFDEEIEFDASCIARTSMMKVREFEARKRVGSARTSTQSDLIIQQQ